MMTTTKTLCARAGATAIAAALALSPVAFSPAGAKVKPIVDLSQSAADTGKPAPAPVKQAKPMIGPFDEQTAEIGGGAIVLLILGAGAYALTRRKQDELDEWDEEAIASEPRDPLFDEPMFHHEEAEASEKSAFGWNGSRSPGEERPDGRREGESWVERAYRGPTPDNPSVSLKTRLKRAAFFDKREREAAAGKAAPVDPDAGLPEALVEQQETEAA